jgi:thiol-disulfide isomerase/thioredoxin
MRAMIICGIALLAGSIDAGRARAEVSGQVRAQAAGRALLGAPAPRFALKTIDGDSIELGDLYGKKAVYLKFWATWCVPCREQMPHFQHVYEAAGPDLAVIAIDVGFNDSVEAIRAYRKKLAITMPIVFDDGRLDAAFHLRVTPTHIVIGRDGRIQYIGHLADKELDQALLKARTVEPRSVRKAGAVIADDIPAVSVGDLLPKRAALRTLDGQRFEFRPAAPERRPTVLVFMSPWCESYLATTRPQVADNCREVRVQSDTLSNDAHARWLGIASGLWANTSDLGKYRAENKIAIPLTLDGSGELYRTFRVNSVPTVIVADRDGRIVRRIEGDGVHDAATLRMAIEGL